MGYNFITNSPHISYNTSALYQINQEIFSIKQYQHLEIAPLEFLSSQIKIKEEEMRLRKKYHDIIKLKNYLLEIAQAGPQAILFE